MKRRGSCGRFSMLLELVNVNSRQTELMLMLKAELELRRTAEWCGGGRGRMVVERPHKEFKCQTDIPGIGMEYSVL